MPGENIYDWSTTALDNGNADALINWVEHQSRASVNNSARSEMAALAKFRNLIVGTITTTGTANAQEFVSGVGYTAVPTGLRVLLKIGIANTGPATLNMDAIGAVAIKTQPGSNLAAGDLVLGAYTEFLYDGTNWILLQSILPDSSLTNGSITTGGTGNAQTIDTGLTQLIVGLRLLLKIGNTNTGPTTLDVDDAGPLLPIPVVYPDGSPLIGGELVAGSYAEFLYDGTNWILLQQVPANPGSSFAGVTLLSETVIASGAASVELTSHITDAFDEYIITGNNLVPSVNGAALRMRVSEDGGATWKQGVADYNIALWSVALTGSSGPAAQTGPQMYLSAAQSNNSARGGAFELRLYRPGNTTGWKVFLFHTIIGHPTAGLEFWDGSSCYVGSNNAINGVQLAFVPGTMISGTVKLYGAGR